MRKFLFALTLCTIGSLAASPSEDDPRLPGYRTTYPMQSLDINVLSTMSTRTRKGNFRYGDSNATINFGRPECSTNIIAGIRNINMSLSSKKIQRENTLYGVLGIDTKYTEMENWIWLGNLVIQPDLRNADFSRTTRYIGSFQGIFAITENLCSYIGAYAEVGIKNKNIKPILGLEYLFGDWKARIIYPIKAGFTYFGIQDHAFSLMLRPFYTAVRTSKGLNHKPSILRYENTGLELRWDYMPNSSLNLWVSLGQTIKGRLTVGDRNNNHRHHIHVQGDPYAQIGITYGFA